MSNHTTDKDLRVFVLIPILANIVTVIAGIIIYNRGNTGAEAIPLAVFALAAPWVIGFFAGRLIELFLNRDDESVDNGFV